MPHKAPVFYNLLKGYNNESFVKVLVESEPSLLQSRHPEGNQSPLFYALANHAGEKVFKALIDAGADLYEVN